MKKSEIKKARENEIAELAKHDLSDKGEKALSKARTIWTSFYRYTALKERILELNNSDEWTYNARKKYIARQENRLEKWADRLNNWLKIEYGLELIESGVYPSIGHKTAHGENIKFYGHFY